MRIARDVQFYLQALAEIEELQAERAAGKGTGSFDDNEDPPESIAEEVSRFRSGEIKHRALSIDASMWVALQSASAQRKDPFFYSDLPVFLEQETWEPKDAMLILAGVSPTAVLMEWSYDNFMGAQIDKPVIRHASCFSDTSDLYDYPIAADFEISSSELKRMIREAKEKEVSSGAAEQRTAELRKRLKEVERWESDETSQFKSKVLGLRAEMVGILKRRWDSGDHESTQRRSPNFFVRWAETRGFAVEWAKWAREHSFIEITDDLSAAPFFDADAEDYPKLLHIAVRAWEHARSGTGGTAKNRIRQFLADRYPELSTSERESIALIANWQKAGGRPKTEG